MLDVHRTVLTKSRKEINALVADGSVNAVTVECQCWAVKGAIRSRDPLRREEGKCVDQVGRPALKRPWVHQEESQNENKTPFYAFPTEVVSTDGIHFSLLISTK